MPIFLDQALDFGNSTLQAAAIATCGNDVNCLFDVAVTGSTAIGASTLSQSTKITNEIAQLCTSCKPVACLYFLRSGYISRLANKVCQTIFTVFSFHKLYAHLFRRRNLTLHCCNHTCAFI